MNIHAKKETISTKEYILSSVGNICRPKARPDSPSKTSLSQKEKEHYAIEIFGIPASCIYNRQKLYW
jgi:hypothetical protein